MAGNIFGNNFRICTWGESHGPAVGVVIDGCPPGLKITEEEIQKEVDRRKPIKGSKSSTARREEDKVQILSGVFEGKTTGTPISMMVWNKDTRSKDYSKIKDLYRPGHADYTYDLKYGHRDYRGGGRSSARETVARVMAAAIAKKILKLECKTEIIGHTIQIGDIHSKKFVKSQIEKNELRCADPKAAKEMLEFVEQIRFKEGDSIGAVIELVVKNPPLALGDPAFDKLDADIAKALMSIPATKGVEVGSGFAVATQRGSENNDQMEMKNGKLNFLSNNAGGILGGISTGEDIVFRLAIKPVSSIPIELKTITNKGKNAKIKTLGRHDCCLAGRAIPVAESMIALVLADKLLGSQ